MKVKSVDVLVKVTNKTTFNEILNQTLNGIISHKNYNKRDIVAKSLTCFLHLSNPSLMVGRIQDGGDSSRCYDENGSGGGLKVCKAKAKV